VGPSGPCGGLTRARWDRPTDRATYQRMSLPASFVVVRPPIPYRCTGRPYCVLVETPGEVALTWRPLTAADLPLLTEWLREPLVARWWNHETTAEAVQRDFGPSVRGEELGEDLVVLVDGERIGLLQRSVIRDYPEDFTEFAAIVDVPDGAVELDYLIGDAARRGRGLGARMIAAVVENTWCAYPAAAAVLVAVVAANTASWRALEKAGLQRIAEGAMSPDNPADDPLHFVYRVDRPRD